MYLDVEDFSSLAIASFYGVLEEAVFLGSNYWMHYGSSRCDCCSFRVTSSFAS